MRDKLIDALNGALKDYVGFVSLDATIKIADQLIAEGFALVDDRSVNKILGMDVSDKEKLRMLAGSFEVGQEFVESNGERFARLNEKLEDGFWKFDVFDRYGSRLYETSAFAFALAREVLSGKLVYGGKHLDRQQKVADVLMDANARYDAAIRTLVDSGKSEEILNSLKAQALREGKVKLVEGYQRNNDDIVK